MFKLIIEFLKTGIEANKAHVETAKSAQKAWTEHEKFSIMQQQIANWHWEIEKQRFKEEIGVREKLNESKS